MPIICIRTYEARCDGLNDLECEGSVDNVLDREEALSRALKAGWVRRGRKWYCPVCQKRGVVPRGRKDKRGEDRG